MPPTKRLSRASKQRNPAPTTRRLATARPPNARPPSQQSVAPNQGTGPLAFDESTSTEVLQLLLAQRHQLVTGSRATLLARLRSLQQQEPQHGSSAAEVPPVPDSPPASRRIVQENPDTVDVTSILEGPNLERLVSQLAPLLTARLQDHSPPLPSYPDVNSHRPSARPSPTPDLDTPHTSFTNTTYQHLPIPPAQEDTAFVDLQDPQSVQQLLGRPSANPMAAHLSKKTEQAITNGEYVDLCSLLPCNTDRGLDPQQFTVSLNNQSVTIPLPQTSSQRAKTKIDSIEKWLTAFSIFMSVIVSKFPNRSLSLLNYMHIIRTASAKFRGMAWYAYDIEFRKRAAKDPSLDWGQRDMQLYLDKFTGLARGSCFSCGSVDHLAENCPLSVSKLRFNRSDTCLNFNRGFACARTPCTFPHRCNHDNCGGNHPSYEHADTRKPSSEEPSHSRRRREK